MSKDEKYLRAHWEWVLVCDGSYRGYPRGTILLNWANRKFYVFATRSAAAKFTRERLGQIRQLEEEVQLIVRDIDISIAADEKLVYQRILASRESALAKLKRGMVVSD